MPESAETYAGLAAYVMFIGYQQSGHSIVGSLLDAHPSVAVSHELHALKYWQDGLDRDHLFDEILANTRRCEASDRMSYGYSYKVSGQWQGRYDRLQVIGDKQGGLSTGIFANDMSMLARFREYLRVPLRVVHVTRNPYDNIASIQLRLQRPLINIFAVYKGLVEEVGLIRSALEPGELIEFRQEDFIKAPVSGLMKLCARLGLDPGEDYVRSCCEIVNPKPSRRRDMIEWDSGVKRQVEQLISGHSFLSSYSFDQ